MRDPWDTVAGWDLAPWLGKHPFVEYRGYFLHNQVCFVAKAGYEAWILLLQLSPQPCSQGTIACVIVKC